MKSKFFQRNEVRKPPVTSAAIANLVLRGFVDIEGLFTARNLAFAVHDIFPERLLAGFGIYAGKLEEVEVVVGLAFAAPGNYR